MVANFRFIPLVVLALFAFTKVVAVAVAVVPIVAQVEVGSLASRSDI